MWFGNSCFSPLLPLEVVKEGELLTLWMCWLGTGDAWWQRDDKDDPSMPGPGVEGWGFFYSHVSWEVLLGAGQTDDGRGMSWGGRCRVISADLHRQKSQAEPVNITSQAHSRAAAAWRNHKPRATPSTTQHVSALWFGAVGRAEWW